MRKFITNTGYAKRKETGEIYETDWIALGKFDDEANYEEATKEEYEAWLEAEAEKAERREE